jgi:hypothetical protein
MQGQAETKDSNTAVGPDDRSIRPSGGASWVPRPPIVLDRVLDDPGLVRRLAERNSPYWPVQRYFASAQEQRALSSAKSDDAGEPQPLVVGPVFRGDWAYDRPLVDGVEPFFDNPQFIEAARKIFGAAVVRPQIVYANLSLPMPGGDVGHTDVPAFRGIDRTKVPIWLLVTMGRSGLFERWRVCIATAVSWFYAGRGGEFTYWPEGPDRKPLSRPAALNTAVVGDNDFMFHRVEGIGGSDDDMVRGLTLDSQLVFAGNATWNAVDEAHVLASYPFEKVRISVSWKAQVFRDREEARVYDEHLDDLGMEQVIDRLLRGLADRDTPIDCPADPLHDAAFVAKLTRAYHRTPTVFPWSS